MGREQTRRNGKIQREREREEEARGCLLYAASAASAQHNYALMYSAGGKGLWGRGSGSYFAYVLRVSHNYAQSQFLNLIKIITVLP